MKLLAALAATLAFCNMAVAANLTWYGHAAFKLVTPTGKVILIDPWITNPANKNGKQDLAAIEKADLILVTHGHSDHVGNSAEIATRTGAKLVSTFDLGKALVIHGGYPKAQSGMETQGNFGGRLSLLDGEVEIAFVPAVHSSAISLDTPAPAIHDAGNPGGFVVAIKGGPVIYHTGDTDMFSDMANLPYAGKINVMLACIGGHFTMDPERAATAVKLVKPAVVVPMHYGTFPLLKGTPETFATALRRVGSKARLDVMRVGETRRF